MTEQKPLKLEVGKAYRTRDGRKVVIAGRDSHTIYPFNAEDGSNYTSGGRAWMGRTDPGDLVAEWDAPNADGWIQWSGGECPVPPDTVVDVRFRDGDSLESTVMAARCWRQSDYVSGGDIVAYRIVGPARATKQEQPMDEKMTVECLFECFANWSDARQAGDTESMKAAAAEAQRFLDGMGAESKPASPTDSKLARLREALRPTIEEWARDYSQPWGKEHVQLENRLIAALLAMHQSGTITINSKAKRPEGGV